MKESSFFLYSVVSWTSDCVRCKGNEWFNIDPCNCGFNGDDASNGTKQIDERTFSVQWSSYQWFRFFVRENLSFLQSRDPLVSSADDDSDEQSMADFDIENVSLIDIDEHFSILSYPFQSLLFSRMLRPRRCFFSPHDEILNNYVLECRREEEKLKYSHLSVNDR